MAGSNEPAIMKTVRSMYNDSASIEISFNLHIFWKIREKEETKSGRIILARGEKFCVEIGSSAWVSNGETLWQYSPEENGGQVVIKRLSAVDVSALPSKQLSAYLDKYSYKLKEERKGVSIVECLPGETKQNSDALRIQISIETKSGTIKELFIVDKSGNESSYVFKKTKTGVKVPEKNFVYTIPKGASVLDLRN
jgi:outer membrane lipoprotein-sorting protein